MSLDHAISIHASTAQEAAQRKRLEKDLNLQWENLQIQMENVERKNNELIKSKKKLTQELEQKSREVKFYEKQCQEQQREIQTLRSQLESAARLSGSKLKFSSASTLTLADAKNHNQLLDQLKFLKEENDSLKKQYNEAVLGDQDKKLRIKVLEDALAFRSEEIGLAGHADLLAKVAQLRGEVSALKKELIHQQENNDKVERDKSQILQERNHFQNQIQQVQQRLAATESDYFKYSQQDVVQLLKNTEKERNVLLDFIQQDMHKSTELAEQLQRVESAYHECKEQREQYLEEKDQLKEEKEQLIEKCKSLDKQFTTIQQANTQLQDKYRQFEEKYQLLQEKYNQLYKEEQEHFKQLNILNLQLRGKDEELWKKNEEQRVLKEKLHEDEGKYKQQEQALLHFQQEKEAILKEKNYYIDRSTQFEQLNQELQEEINRLQRMEQAIIELQGQCEQFYQTHQMQHPYQQSRGENEVTSTNDHHDYQSMSLSTWHVQWTSLPGLRRLYPNLYDLIRQLAKDLQHIQQQYETCQQESNHWQTTYQQTHQQYTQCTQDYQQLQQQFTQQQLSLQQAQFGQETIEKEKEFLMQEFTIWKENKETEETVALQQIETATDLIEEQNSLIGQLQGKLKEIQREMALKQGQIVSAQQQQEHLKQHILSSLSTNIHATPTASDEQQNSTAINIDSLNKQSLSELIQWLLDHQRYLTMALTTATATITAHTNAIHHRNSSALSPSYSSSLSRLRERPKPQNPINNSNIYSTGIPTVNNLSTLVSQPPSQSQSQSYSQPQSQSLPHPAPPPPLSRSQLGTSVITTSSTNHHPSLITQRPSQLSSSSSYNNNNNNNNNLSANNNSAGHLTATTTTAPGHTSQDHPLHIPPNPLHTMHARYQRRQLAVTSSKNNNNSNNNYSDEYSFQQQATTSSLAAINLQERLRQAQETLQNMRHQQQAPSKVAV
jgi:predicted  nucleic acid-binding Zn-ribbon protein